MMTRKAFFAYPAAPPAIGVTVRDAIGQINNDGQLGITPWEMLPIVGLKNRHNLRASFLAGLSHGCGVEPLIEQYEDLPAPLDFRDFIDTGRTKIEVTRAVEEYCVQVLIRNQERGHLLPTSARPLLEKVDLGSSAAETEYQRLGLYFVHTAEYSRAIRSPGALIVGRKGSGKTAIFYQAIEETSSDKRNLVVELSPASHNLSELREQLLKVVSVGVFDHTIAAFWQYILYAEILLKLRETLLPKARYNFSLLNRIRELEEKYRLTLPIRYLVALAKGSGCISIG